jgi:hypothetical protein
MQNKVNGVVQEITPQKSKEALGSNIANLRTTIIGVHVGIKERFNYATMLGRELCLDFMFPALIEFHAKYGKQFRSGPRIDAKFKQSIDKIANEHKGAMEERKEEKKVLDEKRTEAKKKLLSEEQEKIELNA